MRLSVLIMLLLLFSFPQPSIAQEDTCGLAVYGEALKAFYVVVLGQELNTTFTIKNTGTITETITIADETLLVESVSILVNTTPFTLEPDEYRRIEMALRVLNNESDLTAIQILITAEPTDPDPEKNIASASIMVQTWLSISGEVCSLTVQVVDEHHFPFAYIGVQLRRDLLLYGKGMTDLNGSIRFLIAKGNYTVQLYQEDRLLRTKDIEVLVGNYTLTLVIPRSMIYLKVESLTMNVFILLVGLLVGYSIRYAENVWDRRKRREKKAKHTGLTPEERELWQWATRGVD